jgi:hypothetical protein
MHQTPNFNQGSSDYCWAFAGTQLVTAALIKENSKRTGKEHDQDLVLSPTVTMNQALADGLNCNTPCGLVNKISETKRGCSVNDVTFFQGVSGYHPDTGEAINKRQCTNPSHKLTISDVEPVMQGVFNSVQSEYLTEKERYQQLASQMMDKNPGSKTFFRQRSLAKLLRHKSSQNDLSYAFLYNATLAPNCIDLGNRSEPFKGSKKINRSIAALQSTNPTCDTYRTGEFQKATTEQLGTECAQISEKNILSSKGLLNKINQVFDSNSGLPVVIE